MLVGLSVGGPFGWILSYAASLPFFIGVFFFALLGLIIGAVVFRVAAPGRPYGRGLVWIGTAMLVGGVWAVSIVKEANDFPLDMARRAAAQSSDLGGKSLSQFKDGVAADVRHYVTKHYPPGGTIGYIRWVVVSGEVRRGSIESVNRTLNVPQRGAVWVIRSVLSLALLGFGIAAQTVPLSLPRR